MRRSKPFPALEHPLPIDEWQDSLFEQPGQTRRAGAIDDPFGESRKEFSAVTELREDNAPAFDRQGTRSVAVINGSTLLGIEDGEGVLRHDRSLLPGGGRGLRVRRGTNVAEREDILKPRVPQRLMVDVDPTGIAGERARPHEIRRGLGWADVEQIETAGTFLEAAVGAFHRESGFPSRAVHLDEIGFEFQIDPVAFNVVHEGRDILLDPEQYAAGIVEFDGDLTD